MTHLVQDQALYHFCNLLPISNSFAHTEWVSVKTCVWTGMYLYSWLVSSVSALPGTSWHSQVRRSFRRHSTSCNWTHRLGSIKRPPSFTLLLFPPFPLALSLSQIYLPPVFSFSPTPVQKGEHFLQVNVKHGKYFTMPTCDSDKTINTDTMTDLLLSFLPILIPCPVQVCIGQGRIYNPLKSIKALHQCCAEEENREKE